MRILIRTRTVVIVIDVYFFRSSSSCLVRFVTTRKWYCTCSQLSQLLEKEIESSNIRISIWRLSKGAKSESDPIRQLLSLLAQPHFLLSTSLCSTKEPDLRWWLWPLFSQKYDVECFFVCNSLSFRQVLFLMRRNRKCSRETDIAILLKRQKDFNILRHDIE